MSATCDQVSVQELSRKKPVALTKYGGLRIDRNIGTGQALPKLVSPESSGVIAKSEVGARLIPDRKLTRRRGQTRAGRNPRVQTVANLRSPATTSNFDRRIKGANRGLGLQMIFMDQAARRSELRKYLTESLPPFRVSPSFFPGRRRKTFADWMLPHLASSTT